MEKLPAFRLFNPEPLPLNDDAVTVPENVGLPLSNGTFAESRASGTAPLISVGDGIAQRILEIIVAGRRHTTIAQAPLIGERGSLGEGGKTRDKQDDRNDFLHNITLCK